MGFSVRFDPSLAGRRSGRVADQPGRNSPDAPFDAAEVVEHLSITYTGRLAETGIDSSAGSVGDSDDNALADTIIGLFRTEVVKFLRPWNSVGPVEWETLKWIDGYDNIRLHRAIG